MTQVSFKNFDGKVALTVDATLGETLLEVAEGCDARIGHACGGNLACSTCHVYIDAGLDSLAEPSDKENDVLDKAFDVRLESRLACQVRVGTTPLSVEISQESLRAWLDEHPDARR